MELLQVVAPVFGTNCCLLVSDDAAPDGRHDCVVVDAGAGTADEVDRLVAERGLRPRAVLATHGHIDHTWDAAAVCARYDVPLRMHAADAYRVADPFGTLGIDPTRGVSAALALALATVGRDPADYRPPADIDTFDGATTDLAAGTVRVRALHAPGHTEGSTLFVADGVVLSGDVLFAGSIGRTDLPGGDPAAMARTLRGVVGSLDPRLDVVPGHGPGTTVAHELETNPYLPR